MEKKKIREEGKVEPQANLPNRSDLFVLRVRIGFENQEPIAISRVEIVRVESNLEKPQQKKFLPGFSSSQPRVTERLERSSDSPRRGTRACMVRTLGKHPRSQTILPSQAHPSRKISDV